MEEESKSYQEIFELQKCCIIVPTYNNDATLTEVLNDILKYTDQLIVVDDGSTDSSPDILKAYSQIEIIRFPINKGKGVALDDYAVVIDIQANHCTTLQFKSQVTDDVNQPKLFSVQNLRKKGR